MNDVARKYIFIVSGILTLIGVILYISAINWEYTPYLYAVGTAGIAITYLTQPSKSTNVRIRRLRFFLVISGLLLVASSYFMFHQKQEWIICILISAILQLYASFSMPKSEE